MAIYYIDGDNSPGARTQGIENLTENDEVIILYAKANTHYCAESVRNEIKERTKAKLSFVQVCDGKNAVDFAVAVRAGFAAATTSDKLFLISGDKHFDMVAEIIEKQITGDIDIKRVDTLSKALISDTENIANLGVAENLLKLNFGEKEGEAFLMRIKNLCNEDCLPLGKHEEKKEWLSFMQEYYEGHYEDPVGEATRNDYKFQNMHKEIETLSDDIMWDLRESKCEISHKINQLISALMQESVMVCRNAYMMGVKDCCRARGQDN